MKRVHFRVQRPKLYPVTRFGRNLDRSLNTSLASGNHCHKGSGVSKYASRGKCPSPPHLPQSRHRRPACHLWAARSVEVPVGEDERRHQGPGVPRQTEPGGDDFHPHRGGVIGERAQVRVRPAGEHFSRSEVQIGGTPRSDFPLNN